MKMTPNQPEQHQNTRGVLAGSVLTPIHSDTNFSYLVNITECAPHTKIEIPIQSQINAVQEMGTNHCYTYGDVESGRRFKGTSATRMHCRMRVHLLISARDYTLLGLFIFECTHVR